MIRRLQTVPRPASLEAVRAIIEGVFAELTGYPLSHPDTVYIERYSYGGMSGGHISPEFWRDVAMPWLLSRHCESKPASRNFIAEKPEAEPGAARDPGSG